MTDSWSRFESLVDEQIRLAQERGEFDNLPGAGKPLSNRGGADDDLWWIKEYIRREGLPSDALLPPVLQLAKEIERLPEAIRDLHTEGEVRDAVAGLNERIGAHLRNTSSGPRIQIRPVDSEKVVARWRAAKAA